MICPSTLSICTKTGVLNLFFKLTWLAQGNIYDKELSMDPVHLYENGSFEFFPVEGYRFAGRWGLYRTFFFLLAAGVSVTLPPPPPPALSHPPYLSPLSLLAPSLPPSACILSVMWCQVT